MTIRFAIVDPYAKKTRMVDAIDIQAVERMAGLNPDAVDFGAVKRGLGIVVYEYGLLEPPAKHQFFAIDRQLYAGRAVLYAFDESGATVDLSPKDLPKPLWLPTASDVEQAILDRRIKRPFIASNGAVMWVWSPNQKDKVKEIIR